MQHVLNSLVPLQNLRVKQHSIPWGYNPAITAARRQQDSLEICTMSHLEHLLQTMTLMAHHHVVQHDKGDIFDDGKLLTVFSAIERK